MPRPPFLPTGTQSREIPEKTLPGPPGSYHCRFWVLLEVAVGSSPLSSDFEAPLPRPPSFPCWAAWSARKGASPAGRVTGPGEGGQAGCAQGPSA